MVGVQHITVSQAEAGQKLLNFLERRLPGVPRSALMRVIRTGQVRLDGGRTKPFARLAMGQAVRVPPLHVEPPSDPGPATAEPVAVIHHDQGLLIVHKPTGLPVHPGTGHLDCVTARLAAMFPNAAFAPVPAHRLDRDTSGVLACATTYEALRTLQDAFLKGRTDKRYLAWVLGCMAPGAVLDMTDTLAKTGSPGRQRVTAVDREADRGKQARARAVVLENREGLSLVMVRLFTGRTHQIRVQLALRGHAVLGDRKYGPPPDQDDTGRGPAMRLHAWRLTLPQGTFTAPPPWDGALAVEPSLLERVPPDAPNTPDMPDAREVTT